MNFLNKMERRFGRYALTNLSLYIVLTYAAGYLLYMITPQVLTYMTLEPAMILRGQVWRIVSWLLIPPSTQNIFFILITLMFYYSIGTSLERTWGAFRYNVYIFSGIADDNHRSIYPEFCTGRQCFIWRTVQHVLYQHCLSCLVLCGNLSG